MSPTSPIETLTIRSRRWLAHIERTGTKYKSALGLTRSMLTQTISRQRVDWYVPKAVAVAGISYTDADTGTDAMKGDTPCV